MGRDPALLDARTGESAKANSTAVPEDLGQIGLVLTDKTGTLTENEMRFRMASIGGIIFGDGEGDHRGSPLPGPEASGGEDEVVLYFWRCATLCSAAVPLPGVENSQVAYSSPSPDEEALCSAAHEWGVTLTQRLPAGSSVLMLAEVAGQGARHGTRRSRRAGWPRLGTAGEERWTLLEELPFSSERKRMTVLYRHEATQAIVLFTKGADEVLLPRLRPSAASDGARAKAHARRFASAGLRTLALGLRVVQESEYAAWAEDLRRGLLGAPDRRAALEAAFDRLEMGLELLGVTGVEDSLQPGVEETLHAFRDAGIRVWMLTGDKVETAVEVARACRLVPPSVVVDDGAAPPAGEDEALEEDMQDKVAVVVDIQGHDDTTAAAGARRCCWHPCMSSPGGARAGPHDVHRTGPGAPEAALEQHHPLLLVKGDTEHDLKACLDRHAGVPKPYSVLVDGDALSVAMQPGCKEAFGNIAVGATAIICARVTPRQKGSIVRLAREAVLNREGGARVLAVGDGGNDVTMIQEAHIGVGISGKEGRQAARAADYTIGRFRFLARLMFVHGRRAHRLTGVISMYTFYKSIYFASMQLLFNLTTGFSGASFFSSAAVTVWNAPLTMMTGFALLFDVDLPDGVVEGMPALYRETLSGRLLNVGTIAAWWARGVYQAVFCLWAGLSLAAVPSAVWPGDGEAASQEAAAYTVYTAAIYLQVLTIFGEMSSLSPGALGLCVGAIVLFHVGLVAYSELPGLAGAAEGLALHMYADVRYWLSAMVIAVAAMLPVAAAKHVRSLLRPHEFERVQATYARALRRPETVPES